MVTLSPELVSCARATELWQPGRFEAGKVGRPRSRRLVPPRSASLNQIGIALTGATNTKATLGVTVFAVDPIADRGAPVLQAWLNRG